MGNKIGRKRQVVDEKYTRPQGLYHLQDIDHKKLRKLILDSKLAPCYPGDDEGCTLDLEECPICFLYFPSLNRSKCCTKGICTECFLQMKPSHSDRPSQCPFCKMPNYAVEYRGAKTKEEKGLEQVEEQRVIEAKLRIRQQELRDEKGKLHRKEMLSSSSRSLPQVDIDYQDVSGGSHSARCFSYLTQDDEAVSSQDSSNMVISAPSSLSSQNREDNFDLDLENVMMMQAIWQSIQEQGGMQRSPSSTSVDNLPALPMFSECCNPNSTFSVEPPPSSSLACTMATPSASRQMLESSTSMAANQSSGNFHSENWTEDLEQTRWMMMMDHRSNLVDAGTTYASPNIRMDIGLATQPLVSVGMNSENFEDRMMLTVAVSMAEAGARMSSQELMWL